MSYPALHSGCRAMVNASWLAIRQSRPDEFPDLMSSLNHTSYIPINIAPTTISETSFISAADLLRFYPELQAMPIQH